MSDLNQQYQDQTQGMQQGNTGLTGGTYTVTGTPTPTNQIYKAHSSLFVPVTIAVLITVVVIVAGYLLIRSKLKRARQP